MEHLSSFPREEEPKEFRQKEMIPDNIFVDWGPNLPDKYSVDRLAALVRDPECIFFYWELTGGRKEKYIREKGEEAIYMSMLMIEVTHLESGNIFELYPHSEKGNWYFEALPSSTYKASIGLLTEDDEFLVLAESNTVKTPPNGPSGREGLDNYSGELTAEVLKFIYEARVSSLGITSRGITSR